MASQLFDTTSEFPIVTELKVEFVLSVVISTIIKWYDMNQPIASMQLGLIIKDILQ